MIKSAETFFTRLQNGNDVRGAAIETEDEKITLTPSLAKYIAQAFAAYLARKTGKKPAQLRIGAGHDSRITGPAFLEACMSGFAGTKAYDCGLVSTPAMFQSTVLPESNFDGAVMITASHLPFNRNGLKFFTKEGGLEKPQMSAVLAEAAALAEKDGRTDAEGFPVCDIPENTEAEKFDLISVYCSHMTDLIRKEVNADDYDHPLAGLHVIVDAGNGAAGFFAGRILEPLGADISGSVFLDPDGTFPNHVPNPENKTAMEAVRAATLDAGADLGVIFDCDGDRGAVVFSDGTEVNRNTLIALLSAIISRQYPGSTVVTDSVTSDELAEFLAGIGIKHLRFKRGYKNVINKGIECNEKGEECQLAIETSGHGAFKENYFSDDGAYISIKILIEMARLRKEGRDIRSLIAGLSYPADDAEIRFKISGEDFKDYAAQVLEDMKAFAEADERFRIVTPNYEGIRVSFDDEEVKGWFLLRMSLHDPVLPMNIEAKEKGGVQIIMDRLAPFFARYDRLSV